MSKAQIKWAKGHDWYVEILETGDGVLVLDYTPEGTQFFRAFRDFTSLKIWAGY